MGIPCSLAIDRLLLLATRFDRLGAGVFFTYPQIGTFAGVQGVFTYGFAAALPILTFPPLASRIRKLCPHGFVLTEFVRERFGIPAALFLSVFSCLTMFVFMVSELTSVSSVITSLTGLDGLPATIVQVVVTLIYTAIGGLRTSLMTDNIQGTLVLLLMIICAIAIGVQVDIDRDLIHSSGLLDDSKLGWQLLYILPVAIVFNNYFLSGYWQRSFSSKNDKELWWGCILASIFMFAVFVLLGFTGCVAAWAPGVLPPNSSDTDYGFFYLLEQLPAWVVGFCIVFSIALSCSAYDTLQTALVATISNDVFRNRINIWWVRLILVINVPAIVVATQGYNIMMLYLIADLISACLMPSILLGLIPSFYFLRGFEIVVGGCGGFLTVFFFGLVYYNGDAQHAGGLLILTDGLYANDWSAFGAFVAAPVGGLLFTVAGFFARWAATAAYCRHKGIPCEIFVHQELDATKFVTAEDRIDRPDQTLRDPEQEIAHEDDSKDGDDKLSH